MLRFFWVRLDGAASAEAGEEAGDEQHDGDDEEPLEALDEEAHATEDQGQDQKKCDESHRWCSPFQEGVPTCVPDSPNHEPDLRRRPLVFAPCRRPTSWMPWSTSAS